jgi:hypothetical protein
MNLDLTKLRYSEKLILRNQRSIDIFKDLGVDKIG